VQAAWLGGFVGDTAWYALGRLNSAAVRRSQLYLRAAPLIERLVARVGEREIVLSRFVYGTRIASMSSGSAPAPVRALRGPSTRRLPALGDRARRPGLGLSTSAVALVGRSSGRRSGCSPVLLVSLPVLVVIRHVMRRVARER